MPTYDYQCQACEHKFEAFQSITEGALRKCPQCGRLRLKRLLGAGAGLIFRGSGFYITDYRSSSYQDAAKKESGPSEAKSADRPAEKPPAKETKKTPKADGGGKKAPKSPS